MCSKDHLNPINDIASNTTVMRQAGVKRRGLMPRGFNREVKAERSAE